MLAVWRLLRGPRPSRWFWVVLATAVAYWFLAASSAYFEARAPTAGRYQYVGAILILMIAAELARGLRVSRPAFAAVIAVVVIAVAGNLASLVDAYKVLRTTSQTILADLGALELARPYVPPEFQITADTGGTDYVGVQALFYFPAVDAVGSSADSEAELRAAPGARAGERRHARRRGDGTQLGSGCEATTGRRLAADPRRASGCDRDDDRPLPLAERRRIGQRGARATAGRGRGQYRPWPGRDDEPAPLLE